MCRLLLTQRNKPRIFDHRRIRWNVFRRYRLSETGIACLFGLYRIKLMDGFVGLIGLLKLLGFIGFIGLLEFIELQKLISQKDG